MGDLSLVVFNASSKDGAAKALDIAKGLDRDGWIELIDYTLASKNENGRLSVREMAGETSERVAAVAVGAAGTLIGAAAAGPVGAAAGAAVGALTGLGSERLMERVVQDTSVGGLPKELQADSSMLAVVVEERYAERLEEEFQKLGQTARGELKRAERDAEIEAYLQRSQDKIRSIQTDIKADLAKAQNANAAEKAKIDADVASKRADLEARQEKLRDRIKAVNAGIESEIREMSFRLELAGLSTRSAIARGIDRLHRQLNHYDDALETLIEDQIDALKTEASDLKAKAAKSGEETKAAIENHLRAVELRLHRQNATLLDSFEDRLHQLKQRLQNLRVQSTLLRADLGDRIQASLTAAQHSFAELKARVRARNREDERAWKDIRLGFDKASKDVDAAFEQAGHERN
jgi:uncharacterized membrane protein